MAKYKFSQKNPQGDSGGDTPHNYQHLYAVPALAAADALAALEELNIGEARKILGIICRLAERHHLADPE